MIGIVPDFRAFWSNIVTVSAVNYFKSSFQKRKTQIALEF